MSEVQPDDDAILQALLDRIARNGRTDPADMEHAARWATSPNPAAAVLGRQQLLEGLLPVVLDVADLYQTRAGSRARHARIALSVLDQAVSTWQPDGGFRTGTWVTWHVRHAIAADLRNEP